MARFLSPEWFAALEAADAASGGGRPELVVEVALSGLPEGEVRYELVVEGDRARAVPPEGASWPAQIRITSDYATFSGIASGGLSVFDALASGRAKISGDTSLVPSLAKALTGADLVPPALRASTTY